MRLAVVCLALVGCDYVLRLDEVPLDARRDAITGDTNCTNAAGPFTAANCGSVGFTSLPSEYAELEGDISGDPSMRGDELEIFYTHPGAQASLAYATRPSVTMYWQRAGAVPFGDPAAREFDPSVSADGSYVAFISNRGGVAEFSVYIAHRACDTWEVTRFLGPESADVVSIELSYDANALYYSTPNYEIYEIRRSSPNEAFGSPTLVVTGGEWPGISSDELEIFYVKPGVAGVQHATRVRTGIAFDAPTLATSYGADPDVTPDGRTLVLFASGFNGVQYVRRTCP